ncbi:MAG: competence protein ComEC [Patescibacteria group bacterium]|nr:competence protein ComEC [Patescibacteria group bacterium]
MLRLSDVNVNGKTSEGSLWVTLVGDNAVQRSDSVTLRATLQKGFGNFTAVMYRAEVLSVQRPYPGDIALKARDAFATGVQAAVSEPESSLGLGYLVGMRRGLPAELDTALVAAGLTHIVVASGCNLTILVRLARRIFEKISKYLVFLSAATMIAGFIAVTGMSPSMSRAGLVAGLSLLAWYYGRRIHPLVLLPLAMAITVMVQPSYAWGDLGWQLSFAAFAGVLIGAPLIQAYLFGDKKEQSLRRILVETMAAQIWTLPILLLSFGSISVVAPLANMLILPLVPLAMLLTFVAGMSGLMFPESSQLFGFPAELILTYMTKTAEYVGGLSWATQQLQISLIGFVGMYAVIILFTVYMQHKTQLDLQKTSLIE